MEVDVKAHAARIADQGYTIIENAIDMDLIDSLDADLLRLERELAIVPSDNLFEGDHTTRIYNLLVHGPLYAALPVCEQVLDPGLLVSSLSSIAIAGGETPQPIHADDQILPLPKPHPATVCNTMWALTDFTEENGATRIIPGSHLASDSPNPLQAYDSIPAEMPKGSVLIWHGSLWHGGGANTTDTRRVGIAMNYCAGYIRQQENQQLGIPQETVKGFSHRLQQLVGYGIYNGLIGHIDKQLPSKVHLDDTEDAFLLWDYAKVSAN